MTAYGEMCVVLRCVPYLLRRERCCGTGPQAHRVPKPRLRVHISICMSIFISRSPVARWSHSHTCLVPAWYTANATAVTVHVQERYLQRTLHPTLLWVYLLGFFRAESIPSARGEMPVEWEGDRQRVRARARRRMILWAIVSMCMVCSALYGKVLTHRQVCVCACLGLYPMHSGHQYTPFSMSGCTSRGLTEGRSPREVSLYYPDKQSVVLYSRNSYL